MFSFLCQVTQEKKELKASDHHQQLRLAALEAEVIVRRIEVIFFSKKLCGDKLAQLFEKGSVKRFFSLDTLGSSRKLDNP